MESLNLTYQGSTVFEFDVDNWPRWPVEITKGGRESWHWYERIDLDWWYQASESHGWVIYPILLTYWAVTFGAEKWMKDREPLKGLTGLIAAYHILMSLASAWWAYSVVVTFYDNFISDDWYYRSLCVRLAISDRSGFFLVTGAMIRLAQTLDSLCLIFLKKPVPFFQIYHHSISALIAVQLLPFGEPSLAFLGVLNSCQHAITYPYFAAKVLKLRIPRLVPKMILLVELVQMVVGLGSGLYTLQVIRNGGYCIRHPWSIKLFNFAYSTLFILVAHTAYLHVTKQRSRKAKTL